MRMPGGMVGGGAGLIIAIIAALVFGVDPGAILNQAPAVQQPAPGPRSAAEEESAAFVSVVLADTEATWNQLFSERGSDYTEPTLVMFSGSVESACGMAGSAVGPFYCPNDQQVYLDLSFFGELSERFDVIVVDAPPVLPSAAASVIAAVCDGVLFVVRAGRTEQADGRDALDRLRRVGAHVLGAVLNDPDRCAIEQTHAYYAYSGSDESRVN